MKALITAGGRGTRLRPITHTLNKHLIPLANKPMIFYAIEKIANTGIADIGININPDEKEIQKVVGTGDKWGVKITYIKQKGGPKGLGHIIKNAESFIGKSPFLFYLGDNIILTELSDFINSFKNRKLDCLLAFAKAKDPERFGVPVFEKGKLVRIEEKPKNPASNFAVTGIYVYSSAIFEAVKHIKPSARGELEISDAHSYLLQNHYKVSYKEITGWWKDTGKPFDILEGNSLIMGQMHSPLIEGEVGPDAVVQGMVRIGKGTKITGKSIVRGPVVIGENNVLENVYIAPYTSIGNGNTIKNAEIEHSILLDSVCINTSKRLVDSIIGNFAQVNDASSSFPSGHKLIVGYHSFLEI